MSAHFINVMRHALKTFDRSNQAAFSANFKLLKELTSQLTFRDIHLSTETLLNDTVFEHPERAPCTFMHIFENDSVSMSVFVMRKGFTMPLHDHPVMNGFLKCIYGELSIQSYTQQFHEGEPLYNPLRREVCVVPEQPRHLDAESECAVLTPRECNFHSITAVNGVAAFFDILSPPYDAAIPEYGPRRCRFFRPSLELYADADGKKLPQNALMLQRIQAPLSYYCDTECMPEAVAHCTFFCTTESCRQ